MNQRVLLYRLVREWGFDDVGIVRFFFVSSEGRRHLFVSGECCSKLENPCFFISNPLLSPLLLVESLTHTRVSIDNTGPKLYIERAYTPRTRD